TAACGTRVAWGLAARGHFSTARQTACPDRSVILRGMSAPIREVAPARPIGISPERALVLGRNVLATEAAAIRSLEARPGAAFLSAARILFECRGRAVVIGIGKSGHIGRKLAATLASTGTPA